MYDSVVGVGRRDNIKTQAKAGNGGLEGGGCARCTGSGVKLEEDERERRKAHSMLIQVAGNGRQAFAGLLLCTDGASPPCSQMPGREAGTISTKTTTAHTTRGHTRYWGRRWGKLIVDTR